MKDSPRESSLLVGVHERTYAPDLPHHVLYDYNAALCRRGSLSIWFDPETHWLALPTGKPSRQAVSTDAAIQVCLTQKAVFGLPLRQTTGMMASLLELAGLDWPVRDFSSKRPA